MEKITAHIRPIDWTMGDVSGMDFRLSGVNPFIQVNWGDGKSETFHGNEISARHTYDKSSSFFVVEAYISAERIDYVYPTGGDCDYELIDFSQAPSIYEIFAQRTRKLVINNPNLEFLNLKISQSENYDLSKCPKLRDFGFSAESNEIQSLDLSYCHNLRTFSYFGYSSPNLRKVTFANDAPLYEANIHGHNFLPSCLEALRRIIERNNGYIIGEFEEDDEE